MCEATRDGEESRMKRENPSASHPPHTPARHQFEHEVPTVIHNPEEDMTALGRWFHHAYLDPVRFWGWTGAIVLGVIAAVTLASYLSNTGSPESVVWARLEETQKPGEKVELAKEFSTSPASSWALLQAATEYYQDGFGDLPNNRDAALPSLKKALDLFDQVAKEAPKDSPQARHAALGKARTLEARSELSKAVEQYKLVAKTWPGTAEAKQADSLAKALESPAAVAFYKELDAYKPPKVDLPSSGLGSLPSSVSLPDLDLSKMTPGLTGGNPVVPGSSSFPLLPSPPVTPTAIDPLPALPKTETKPSVEEPSTAKPAAPDAPKDKPSTPPPPAKPETKAAPK